MASEYPVKYRSTVAHLIIVGTFLNTHKIIFKLDESFENKIVYLPASKIKIYQVILIWNMGIKKDVMIQVFNI